LRSQRGRRKMIHHWRFRAERRDSERRSVRMRVPSRSTQRGTCWAVRSCCILGGQGFDSGSHFDGAGDAEEFEEGGGGGGDVGEFEAAAGEAEAGGDFDDELGGDGGEGVDGGEIEDEAAAGGGEGAEFAAEDIERFALEAGGAEEEDNVGVVGGGEVYEFHCPW
jgi:hypothetical protein